MGFKKWVLRKLRELVHLRNNQRCYFGGKFQLEQVVFFSFLVLSRQHPKTIWQNNSSSKVSSRSVLSNAKTKANTKSNIKASGEARGVSSVLSGFLGDYLEVESTGKTCTSAEILHFPWIDWTACIITWRDWVEVKWCPEGFSINPNFKNAKILLHKKKTLGKLNGALGFGEATVEGNSSLFPMRKSVYNDEWRSSSSRLGMGHKLRPCAHGLKDRNQFCPPSTQSHWFWLGFKKQTAVPELGCVWEHSSMFCYSSTRGNQPAGVNDSALVLLFYTHYLSISCVSKTVAQRRVLFHSKPRLKTLTFPLAHPYYTLLSHYLQIILFTELSGGKKSLFSTLNSSLSTLWNAGLHCDVTGNITTRGLVFMNSRWFP